ncbi:hypothetical protein PILCRDRAFT_339443 [Piloderma croceum F 1598]|uniref:Uncharacterized protein n=1 Tax=Piloderma croceum (strain F 1598) TaxID=765440 RepID=A0A0C3G4S6_PILCF|nr:hypothetical protein PILCRDRAFT_339443 [Piloderma croceum F 1598]
MEMIIKRYQELETDPTALKHFVDHQQNLSSQMMETATHLAEWARMSKSQKAAESWERMQNREASIEAKLLELGWVRDDFPSEWDSKWHALIKQPRELTPHLWKILRPKLEALLEEHKHAQAEAVIRIRRDQREREFEPIWDEFVVSHSWDSQPWSLPRFVDACELPAINRMLAEDESRIPVTAERWQAVVGFVPNDLNRFADQVMRDIVKLLKVAASETNTVKAEAATAEDAHEDMDSSIFKRASSLLSCGVTGCQNLYTFPEILEEEHVTPYRYRNFRDRKWPDLLSRLKHEPEVFRCASLVLKTLGWPEDTHLAAFDECNIKLICLCGNPKFQQPMDFRSLCERGEIHLILETLYSTTTMI